MLGRTEMDSIDPQPSLVEINALYTAEIMTGIYSSKDICSLSAFDW
jgi:hypothetical protein